MKLSRFNNYFTADDGSRLVFNAYTCALAIVEKEYDELLNLLPGLTVDSVPDELKKVFDSAVAGRFIVDDDCDELLDYRMKRNLHKYNTSTMGLTIAPTLSCNFKCVYCYETPKPGVMSEETQGALISFVGKMLPGLKGLDVTWYGGEPLMATHVIDGLSSKLMAACKDSGVAYHGFIITNGSLIKPETVEEFRRWNIHGAQITIDGPKEVHDARRISRNDRKNLHGYI